MRLLGEINWQTFDWQSFATLATGFAAVAAAFLVSRLQVDLQRRQTSIQETMLRSELFSRRYHVFEKTEKFLLELLRSASDSNLELNREFVIAHGESRFLFSSKVVLGLDEIWKKWVSFHEVVETMRMTYESDGHYGEGLPQRKSELLHWFSDRYRSLPDLFDEMRLGYPLS